MPLHTTNNPEIRAYHIATHEAKKADSYYDAGAYFEVAAEVYEQASRLLKGELPVKENDND